MRTTAKHFKEFKAEFLRWQEYFGRMDWEIFFELAPLKDADAELYWDIEGKNATVKLNIRLIREDPKISAFHEAVELWLLPIRYLIGARFIDRDTMVQELHGIVRFIENRFYPLIKGGGK